MYFHNSVTSQRKNLTSQFVMMFRFKVGCISVIMIVNCLLVYLLRRAIFNSHVLVPQFPQTICVSFITGLNFVKANFEKLAAILRIKLNYRSVQ